MTKNILAAVGGLALGALLGANAVATFGAGERSPSALGGGLRVADLPIDRHFHVTLNPALGPSSIAFPSNTGCLIAKVAPAGLPYSGSPASLVVYIDGFLAARLTFESPSRTEYLFDPPLLVAPGSTLTFTNPGGGDDFNIGGYRIYDTDL